MTERDGHLSSLGASLSPAAAWAFAIGTSVGWGSLVVTANTYLAQAGPFGSVLGLAAGALVMLLVSRNYAYMMNAFPDAGGAYTYAREMYGWDQGFLVFWFLCLTYLAMLWANATSLPLFARYFLGDLFQFGKLYTVFGYDVYLGGVLLSAAALVLTALLCIRWKRAAAALMVGMAVLFSAGIVLCFAFAMLKRDVPFAPAFLPDTPALSQIVKIAVISPWAFIGFENISHSVEEFSFRRAKTRGILIFTVITTTILYICVTLLSVTAYPPEYDSWLAYIRDLGNLEGIRGLPAFYAANRYMGSAGVGLLMLSLLALILTSLIGNLTALSRLFYALGKDGVLPKRFASLNRWGVPQAAILLITGASLGVLFIGRTAIGWIVDVTTLGAVLVYGFVSASAFRLARRRGDKAERVTGFLGLAVMVCFGAYMLVPNLFGAGSLASESLLLFVIWSVLGFICFRRILKEDQGRRFGQSIIVWIALLSLVLFVGMVWMNQSVIEAAGRGMAHVEEAYTGMGAVEQAGLVSREIALVRQISARSILVVIALFALSLGILINNYNLMRRRATESEIQLGLVRDRANTDPLTGVKSKHAFAEKESAVNELIASGQMEPFALAVCDVNGLKQVNDTYGHKAGDEHIRKACHMICLIFAHSPIYRIGGDEFVAFLTGDDYENREALMEELHRQDLEHIETGDVVVSGGLAEFGPGDREVHGVFERADGRMYQEKVLLKSMGAPSR